MLQENINISKFIESINKLNNKYGYKTIYPGDLTELVKVFYNKQNQPYAIHIQTNSGNTKDGQLRVRFGESEQEVLYGILTCDAFLYYGEDGNFRHEYYSFHFEATEGQERFLTFRFDYDPEAPFELHAHDYNYGKTDKHLQFPDDIKLDLNLIDFCTTMQILAYYFLHEDKYPLEHGEEYTGIIKGTRSIYDEER